MLAHRRRFLNCSIVRVSERWTLNLKGMMYPRSFRQRPFNTGPPRILSLELIAAPEQDKS
jgi:hypothetical protein